MARDYPGQCAVSTFVADSRNGNPGYVSTIPSISFYESYLYEAWYGRTSDDIYNEQTNWYQLATNWITAIVGKCFLYQLFYFFILSVVFVT
mgnify:CR=1 FL=1